MIKLLFSSVSILVASTVCGCSSDKDSGGAAGSAGSAASTSGGAAGSGGSGTSNEIVGTFTVLLVPAAPSTSTEAYSGLIGKVYDGPMPLGVVWVTTDEAGGCQLRTPRVPFCGTPCGGGALCVETDQCRSYPKAQDLGTVHVKGLGSMEFDMSPIAGSYQPAAEVQLPYPPAPEGAPIHLQTAGGVYDSFALDSSGIAPLVLAGTAPLAISVGKPIDLAWTPPANGDAERIQVKLDISHHGGQKGEIDCEAADTGSLQIPASLVSKLIDLGVAGFPSINVTRVSTGTTTIAPGRVALVVSSTVERAVALAGVVSCTGDNDCASGQKCRDDLTCGN